MKLNKVFALLLGAVLFVGCSDDDESWNSSNATVSMGKAELSFKENKGIVSVPVVVEGEQNGPILVTVEVAENGTNPAMDDVHYMVTSKTILIPADSQQGSVEFITVDDNDINEARTFTMTITHAEGAKIGTTASTLIALKDNDSAFYEKLQGKWKMTATSLYGGDYSWDVNVVGYEEGQDGYDEVLYITGMMGYSWTQATLLYTFDPATKKVTASFVMGTMFASEVDFGLATLMDAYLCTVKNNQYSVEGTIEGTCNDEFTSITFEEKPLYFRLAPTGTTDISSVGNWDGFIGISMTR